MGVLVRTHTHTHVHTPHTLAYYRPLHSTKHLYVECTKDSTLNARSETLNAQNNAECTRKTLNVTLNVCTEFTKNNTHNAQTIIH